MKKTGYEKLRDDLIAIADDHLQTAQVCAEGESPIEHMMFVALACLVQCGGCEYRSLLVPPDAASLSRLLATEDPTLLIVQPQAQLPGWRVDFLIYAWDYGRATGRAQWRRLIVECDGHDFHERTKEQAARDRSRDRAAQIAGATVLRFTGSEIHADPLACARQVAAWGTMGW